MASSLCFALSALFLFLSVISPALSQTCSSQRFSNNRVFDRCVDLPTLGAKLHWRLSRSALSVAFVAPPATSNGWIAWAINPTGKGMAGSQALIALKNSNGTITVQTYNISSYSSIVPSRIAFDVSDPSAEQSGQNFQIFATLALPSNLTTINHVWQVGSSVNNGMPARHDFAPQNLQSTATLDLLVSSTPPVGSPRLSPAPGKAPSPNSPAPNSPNPTAAPPTSTPRNGGNKMSLGSSLGITFLSVFFISFLSFY